MTKFATLIFAVFLAFLTEPSPLSAASFDCSRASTDIEHAICNNPELSRLDEQLADHYFSLNEADRYTSAAREQHRNWLRSERTADPENLREQLSTLQFFHTLNFCAARKNPSFYPCITQISDLLETCIAAGDHTTFIMNQCGSALISAYRSVVDSEAQYLRERLTYDPETVDLFNEAQASWDAFILQDCRWQYSEYRDGTIRGIIYSGCMIKHFEVRLGLLADW